MAGSAIEQANVIEKDANGKIGSSKDEVEGAREDGELPSLVTVTDVSSELTLPKGPNIDHDRQLELISKSVPTLMNKSKSQSFKKLDEDPDLMVESDGEFDEPANIDHDDDDLAAGGNIVMNETSTKSYGVSEFSLVLMRKINFQKKDAKLDAKVS